MEDGGVLEEKQNEVDTGKASTETGPGIEWVG
jgi:hypothetical protein